MRSPSTDSLLYNPTDLELTAHKLGGGRPGSASISPVPGRKTLRRLEDRLRELEEEFEEWKARCLAAEKHLWSADSPKGSGDVMDLGKGKGPLAAASQKIHVRKEDATEAQEGQGFRVNGSEGLGLSVGIPDAALPALAVWVMRESTMLTTVRRALADTRIPTLPDKPVLVSQRSHSMAISWIDSQQEALKDWLVKQLPSSGAVTKPPELGARRRKSEVRADLALRSVDKGARAALGSGADRRLRRRRLRCTSSMVSLGEESSRAGGVATRVHSSRSTLHCYTTPLVQRGHDFS
ncbi:hypothetical protein ONZ45_g16802 [Pleurotus djamor]|nr:hypothetical protein ONZ45_g16802 [Pleurotus djamor]